MPLHVTVAGGWLIWAENDFEIRKPDIVARIVRCRIEDCQPEEILFDGETFGPDFEVDSKRRELFAPGPSGLVALGDTIYWLSFFSERLLAADLDGNNVRIVATGIDSWDLLSTLNGDLILVRPHQERVERFDIDALVRLASGEEPQPEVLVELEFSSSTFTTLGEWGFFVDLDDQVQRVRLLPASSAPSSDPSGTSDTEPTVELFWPAQERPEEPEIELPPGIHSLTVADGRLYWAELHRNRVVSSDLQGRDERVIATDSLLPGSVSVLGDHVYWKNHRGLSSAPVDGGEATLFLEQRDVESLAAVPAVAVGATP